ncbi:alkaline phosphatase [Ideonella sp. BN130291]|uniref:alkaline phosphatase n=1 Tax=Ideonella sp. BN130291 TaxID=3112940 RepID=UPI002E2707EE|nr:alkaline phosphatase [Ideonella sp. BN130291]
MKKNTPVVAGAAAVLCILSFTTAAAEPAVRGPEKVQDWYDAGQRFIRESKAVKPITGRAKNVILFVGDGMGVSTQTAARILEGQLRGQPGEENRLSFETFPYSALSKTYSWDQQTSDSAPTISAIMTGYKTREGMLGVDHLTPRNDCDAANVAAHSVETMLELAAEHGKATGVVTTARLTHATPAGAYAHVPARDWEADTHQPAGCGVKDIARQLIEVSPAVRKSLKVALGGGRSAFLPRQPDAATVDDPEYGPVKGGRTDGRNLTAEWLSSRGNGAQYVWNKAQFDAIDLAGTEHLLGLFEPSHMRYEADRAQDQAGEPSLTEMTDKAIRLLSRQRQGFFLEVEAGRIDHGHHGGNAKRALLDTIELSNAVRRAMELTRESDTLIIVTADHSHVFTIAGYPHRGNNILGVVKDVPEVDGNPTAPAKDQKGLPYTTLGYQNGPGHREGPRTDLSAVDTTELDFHQEAAIPMESETHGGEDVAIWARGPRAHLVRGSMEENWIFHVMRNAFGF